MRLYSLLYQCHDALLALSDPDLLLLVHQWIETRDWSMDDAPTVEETVENQVCLDLGYTVHVPGTGSQYRWFASFIEAEDAVGPGHILSPPPAQQLRVRLANMRLPDFKRTVIACAYQAPRSGSTMWQGFCAGSCSFQKRRRNCARSSSCGPPGGCGTPNAAWIRTRRSKSSSCSTGMCRDWRSLDRKRERPQLPMPSWSSTSSSCCGSARREKQGAVPAAPHYESILQPTGQSGLTSQKMGM